MSDPQGTAADSDHPSQAEGEDPEHPADAEVLPETSEHPSQAEGEDPEQSASDVPEPGTPSA